MVKCIKEICEVNMGPHFICILFIHPKPHFSFFPVQLIIKDPTYCTPNDIYFDDKQGAIMHKLRFVGISEILVYNLILLKAKYEDNNLKIDFLAAR